MSDVVVTATRTVQPSDFALASTPGAIGTSPTTTLAITASVFQSSWATPAITVPFPSYYGNQIRLSYDWTATPTAGNPSRLGGSEATSGVASVQAAAQSQVYSGGNNSGGGDGGFQWPTWATAVIAGVGGAALLAILAGCCIWRKKRKNRNRRKYALANERRRNGAQDRPHSRPEDMGREHKRGMTPLTEKNGSGSSLTVVGSGRSTPSGRSRKDEKYGEKRRLKKGETRDYRDPANGGYIDVPSRESGQRSRSRGRQHHGSNYPPPPVPPMPVAAGVDLHAPQHQHERGHSPYRPVGINDLAHAPYPTDEYGNPLGPPISPFRATHRRYGSGATDDSGYDTPGGRTFDGANSSTNGSPARLLPNAAPNSYGTPVGLGAPRAAGPYAWTNDSREHQPIVKGHGPRQLYRDDPTLDEPQSMPALPPSAPASSHGHGVAIGNAMMSASDDDEDDAEDQHSGQSVGIAHGGASSGDLVSSAAEGRQAVAAYPAGDVRNRQQNRLSATDVERPRSGDRASSAQSGEYHDAPVAGQQQLAEGYRDVSEQGHRSE